MIIAPPGWTKISVESDPTAKVQAVCKDSKGRLQYIYHPLWTAIGRHLKSHTLKEFIRKAGRLRTPDDPASWVLRIMLDTNIRIGSKKYTEDNGSYGITTLLCNHVHRKKDSSLVLSFLGKSGVAWETVVPAGPTANYIMLTKRSKKPNDVLFDVSADVVRRKFKQVFGQSLSPKILRTYSANKILFHNLKRESKKIPTDTEPLSKIVSIKNLCIKQTAIKLNHSPSICKNDYICHEILDRFSESPRTFHNLDFAKFFRNI